MKKRLPNTNYSVTSEGFVEDSEGIKLSMIKKNGGNFFVKIPKLGFRSVPKLVTTAFLGPHTKRIIHLDGNRSNNAIWNLELIDHTHIINLGYKNLYESIPKRIINKILALAEIQTPIAQIKVLCNVPLGLICYTISERNKNNLKKT